MIDDVLELQLEEDKTTIEHMKTELLKVRTGRASANLLDTVIVNYYGTPTKLKQLANIGVPEARLLTVQPFDKSAMQDVEKAIMAANLGLNPSSEGNIIRIPIPALTEERRKDLVIIVKKYGEESRIGIRSHRKEANDALKKAKSHKDISEDECKKAMEKVQKATDAKIVETDKLVAEKEKDVLTI